MREKWVNVYVVTRHYGGPQEGGWWRNRREAIAAVPVCKGQRPERIKAALAKHFDHLNDGNIYSVLGGVAVEVCVEDVAKESERVNKPGYE
jgi:hypothetical protein